MRNVLVSFEVSVTQSQDPFVNITPDYKFDGEFDKDDDKSFSKMCDLEYQVEELARAFKKLGCQVIVLRKEVTHLDIN